MLMYKLNNKENIIGFKLFSLETTKGLEKNDGQQPGGIYLQYLPFNLQLCHNQQSTTQPKSSI